METPSHASGAPRVLLVGDFSASRVGNRSVSEELRDRLAGDGWPVVAASAASGSLRRALGMMAAVLRNRQRVDLVAIDVFSGRAFWWAEAVTRLARRLGLPIVATLHGGALPDYARRHPGRVERLLRRATRVVAPSPYMAQVFGSAEEPIETIPNPLPLAEYDFRLRREVVPDLAWLRSIGALYDPQTAVRALARIRRHYPTATLTLYGPDRRDGTAAAVDLLIRSEQLADAVRCPGAAPKAEVPRRLAAHDIFLNTSRVDNAPVSVLEAMATGLPVVSTDVGGIPHLLEDGRTALLVPVGDDRAIAAAVERLLAEPELAESLSRQGRARVEGLDWREVLPAWQDLFRSVSEDARATGDRA